MSSVIFRIEKKNPTLINPRPGLVYPVIKPLNNKQNVNKKTSVNNNKE